MTKTHIALRVDASSQIGTGHFMRCLALADELSKQDVHIRFLSRNLPAYLTDMLSERGLELVSIETFDESKYNEKETSNLVHASWLGTTQFQDAKAAIKGLSDKNWDCLIVDHYALDICWENQLRSSTKKIMVIDDLGDRQHDCDILLDQNYYVDMQTRYYDKVPAHCKLLLGPGYALLREEFRIFREQAKIRNGKVKKILVFFGGMDPDNFTMLAIKALSLINTKLDVDVVIGAKHPFEEEIKKNCINNGFVCHVQTPDMAKLMVQADLAIGAGGTSIWERCCLGLPAISLCVAENQRIQITDAAELGVLLAPVFSQHLINILQIHITSLLDNPALLKLISKASMKVVDANGTLKISKILRSIKNDLSEVTVRSAFPSDDTKVWPWRNYEATKKYFFDKSELVLDDHIQWWHKSIADKKRVLLLGVFNNSEFGVVRFDFLDPTKAQTSIYLNPEMVGQGLGRELLIKGIAWLRDNYPKLEIVLAEIMSENITSIRLFESIGFYELNKTYKLELGFEKK